nr:TRIC cation channel family protein [uncultured Friedmanniella sp.]
MLLASLTFLGVAVFAASGALAGVRRRLDLFGVCVVGLTTGLGGGIARDLLLGVNPPASFEQWPNATVALAAALVVFFIHPHLGRLRPVGLVYDAVGLGIFATTSAAYALDLGASGFAAVLIGAVGAVGGGVLRDILVNEVPLLLRRDLYAVPALLGSLVVVLAAGLGWSGDLGLLVGTVAATGLRLLALWRDWNFPVAFVDPL